MIFPKIFWKSGPRAGADHPWISPLERLGPNKCSGWTSPWYLGVGLCRRRRQACAGCVCKYSGRCAFHVIDSTFPWRSLSLV